MTNTIRVAGSLLALSVIGVFGVPSVQAQTPLPELMRRYGVDAKAGLEAAFDSHATPDVAVTAGALATPLALITASTGKERVDGAYAFGILAGWSGKAAAPQELAAAGQSLVAMIASEDRRTRIAGARVAGRVFAAPFDGSRAPSLPQGLVEALFAV